MSLLDDVSIVVTPNGYKAGELYAVVPVPVEGAELVTNGDFSTDANWTKNSGWTISGGSANCDGTQTGNSGLVQQNGIAGVSLDLQIGKQYKMVIDVTVISGAITYIEVASDYQNDDINATGVSTLYFSPTSTNDRITIAANSTFVGSVNSVSVKEYTAADMDVTRATAATRVDEAGLVNYAEIVTGSDIITDGDFPNGSTAWALNGWTISNNAANCSGITANMIQTISGSTNKTYSLTFTISNYVSGNVIPAFVGGNSYSKVYNANGTFTEVISSYSDTRFVFYATSFTGSIDNVSVKEVTRDNVPRIDYSGGGCPHILAEPQRTNLITYSEDFTDSSWATFDCTVGSTSNIQPNGVNEGYSLTYTADIGVARTFESVVSGSSYTFSAYIKSSQNGTIKMARSNQPADGQYINVTTDWKRFDVQITPTSTTDGGGFYRLLASDLSSIEVYGAQLEEGSYATSYIPTSGSTVTRNQDQFTRDGIGSLINSTEGVLFLEMAALSNDTSFRAMSISDGTTSNRITLVYNGGIRAFNVVGGSVSSNINYSTTITTTQKIAIVWSSSSFALWVNGSKISSQSGISIPSSTLNKLSLDQGNGGNNMFAKVKQLQVYKTALTDEQLIQLTGESGTDFYESYAEMASALTYTIQ